MAAEQLRQPDATTSALLQRAAARLQAELIAEVAAAGFEIRAKHGAVLANLDPGGTRPTELAQRAGMGKPALGELVDELEAMGYVRRQPDPQDGRAKLVVPTDEGWRVIAAAALATERIEARLHDELGAATYGRLRRALDRMIGAGVLDLRSVPAH